MTIRSGGRPRDPRSAAWSPDPRSLNGRRLRRRRGSSIGGVLRFLAFALVLGAVVVGGALTILRPVVSDALVGWGYDNPGALRIPFVADLVRERLGPALTTAPSRDATEVVFTVNQGDNVESVAQRLEDEGLVIDARAFVFQATERGLASRLSAGDFGLARNMTPDEIVTGLIENEIVEPVQQFVEKIFREGLRIDQMAAFIQTWEEDLAVDAAEFREIATAPPAELLADYPWLQASGLPEGAPLEGYLFPAAYDLTADMTAEELIRAMLDRFIKEVGQERVAQATFYERLKLASIVEREARVPEERPLIAGVYQNRLNSEGAGQILNADPTVNYALDTVELRELPFEQWPQFVFWEARGNLAEVQLPDDLAAYNTYQVRGLPPTPIAAPGLSSVEAALAPNTEAGFFYFLAIPDGSGAHVFAKTLEEHNANRRQYGYQ